MPTDRAMMPLSAQLFGDEVLSGSIFSVYICLEREFNCTSDTSSAGPARIHLSRVQSPLHGVVDTRGANR
jgi:hypothetical protein